MDRAAVREREQRVYKYFCRVHLSMMMIMLLYVFAQMFNNILNTLINCKNVCECS